MADEEEKRVPFKRKPGRRAPDKPKPPPKERKPTARSDEKYGPNPYKWGPGTHLHKTDEWREAETIGGRSITARQRKFCQLFAEGTYTVPGAMRKAGFSEKTIHSYGPKFLNQNEYPQIVAYLAQMHEERQAKYGVTLDKQLKRLHDLSLGAEEAGQFSAAINAERIRSGLAGLTTDRREVINKIDTMDRGEIISRLEELARRHPQLSGVIEATAVEVKPSEHGTRDEVMEQVQKKLTEGGKGNEGGE